MDYNKMKREIVKELKDLIVNDPKDWVTKEEVLKKFGVSDRTLYDWVRDHPIIERYRPSKKGSKSNGVTIKSCPMYNVRLILDKVFTSGFNDKNAA